MVGAFSHNSHYQIWIWSLYAAQLVKSFTVREWLDMWQLIWWVSQTQHHQMLIPYSGLLTWIAISQTTQLPVTSSISWWRVLLIVTLENTWLIIRLRRLISDPKPVLNLEAWWMTETSSQHTNAVSTLVPRNQNNKSLKAHTQRLVVMMRCM